jgi:hypothetical protein
MNLFELPSGLVRSSLATTAVVAASWWVNYELSSVASTTTTFLPIFLLALTARVILGFAFCGACAGIGMGSVAISMMCFRLPSRIRSPHELVRYSKSCLSIIVALVVFTVTYGIGNVCMGTTGFFADCVMFAGLQVSEFLFLRRILRWRRAKEMVAL